MKIFYLRLFVFFLINLSVQSTAQAQKRTLDLENKAFWQVYNREVASQQKDSVVLKAASGDGMMMLKNENFGSAIIEFDVRGEDIAGQSFVGMAFNVQDEKNYEAIYFRPFNFKNSDTSRRSRAVQYVSMPAHPWEKLRAEHPGVYENRVNPVPDPNQWFHVKLVINKPAIQVFVNGSNDPCLQVKSLSSVTSGTIALWVGNGSKGSFSHLTITTLPPDNKIAYGNNPQRGKYFNVGDARLYYEIYGEGSPVVLLHGGVYGYIDEFEYFIDALSRTNQVICIATRGHGKSEIGNSPFTWQQRAEDAYKIIRHITKDSVTVLGFSDGAAAAYKLAAIHPDMVEKLIAIGFGDLPAGSRKQKFDYNPDQLLKAAKGLFESRLSLMPEPERWGECLSKLNKMYNDDILGKETFEKIKCPVLLMSGDKDDYYNVDAMVRAYHLVPGSRLAIIPGCAHVVFYCNFPGVWENIKPFLKI